MGAELELIEKIASIARSKKDSALVFGIGDDCAIITPPTFKDAALAITTDTMVEGVHFNLSYYSPFLLGRKAAASNLSDLAAVGARPRWALLTIEVSSEASSQRFWDSFSKGLSSWLYTYDVSLIGGDTVSSGNGLSIGLTLIGEVDKTGWLRRSGARPGDLIYCSGFLGEGAMGLHILEKKPGLHKRLVPKNAIKRLIKRHLDPTPRIELGLLLRRSRLASSCIDLSDGLATDLAHICRQSDVGALLFQDRLPLSRALRLASRALGYDPNQLALTGGEDYELVWTGLSQDQKTFRVIGARLGLKVSVIGQIIADSKNRVILQSSKGTKDITFKGYEHLI